MKQCQQNILSMWRAVRQLLDLYNSVWHNSVPFVKASAVLTNAIGEAKFALGMQSKSSIGFTKNARELVSDALKQVMAIARSAKVYALDVGSHELFAAVNHSKGYLKSYSQNELSACLRSIVHAARAYSDELKEYGVAADAYGAALKTIELAEIAQSLVRTTISGRKAVTTSLPDIFYEGRMALLKMDNLIHLFESSEPAFVSAYKATRIIVHAGTRHRGGETHAA